MKGALGAGCPEFKLMGALISSLNPRIREISRATPGDPTSTVGVRRCVISRRAMAVMPPHSKGDGGMQEVPSPKTVEVNATSATGTPVSKSKATTRDPANEYVRLERNEIDEKIKRHARKEDEDDVNDVCGCTLNADAGGCYDKCVFRGLFRQCSLLCPNAQIGMCGNRVFRDASKHPKTKVLDCEDDRGLGLFADAAIKKDSFVIEYIGQVIELTKEELEQRKDEYKKKGLEHSYFKQLRAGVYIDPTKKGNDARYMNHSDTPNCRGEKWDVDGEECIGIFAKADIKAGEELTWDYGDGFFSDGHTVNESIAATETLGETVTVEAGEPDDAMTTPTSKEMASVGAAGAAEPTTAVETGAVANATDTPMVSKASSRRLSFMTPMGSSRQQESCTPMRNHYLTKAPPTKLPSPTLQQGAQQQTIENDEGEDSESPNNADKPQAGVVCAVWNCTTENRNKTPTWRPGPDGSAQLCNACGDKYSKDKARLRKLGDEGWYEMLKVKSKRSPQPRGEAPVPPPSSRKRARKESPSIVVVQGTKGKSPWPKEASTELEKCVKASLDAGIPLRGKGGAFENGCKIHTRLGFKMHRKNRYNQPTESVGCKCNASQDEWCDHIQPRLEADKDSWYMVGNYGNLLQKSRRKKPNTVDDEEDDEPGDKYMSERDFGGTEDDSQTSEEEGEPFRNANVANELDTMTQHFYTALNHWLPLAEQHPKPSEITFFYEMDAHFRATGLYDEGVALSVGDRIAEVEETVNHVYDTIEKIDPDGLLGYLTSGDIPSDEKRSSTSTSPTQRAPGTPPPPSETLQELTKGSFEKVINEVAPLTKTGASFIDIGCGRGNCCLHWKIFYPESTVAGVDRAKHRIQIAKEVTGKIGQDVSFSCEDAADEEGAIDFDIVYSFDKVFTDHDREAIYRRLNASPQWKVFVTFRKLREEVEGARLVSTLQLSVQGCREKHTAYVYEKDRLLALYNKAVRSSQSVVE